MPTHVSGGGDGATRESLSICGATLPPVLDKFGETLAGKPFTSAFALTGSRGQIKTQGRYLGVHGVATILYGVQGTSRARASEVLKGTRDHVDALNRLRACITNSQPMTL